MDLLRSCYYETKWLDLTGDGTLSAVPGVWCWNDEGQFWPQRHDFTSWIWRNGVYPIWDGVMVEGQPRNKLWYSGNCLCCHMPDALCITFTPIGEGNTCASDVINNQTILLTEQGGEWLAGLPATRPAEGIVFISVQCQNDELSITIQLEPFCSLVGTVDVVTTEPFTATGMMNNGDSNVLSFTISESNSSGGCGSISSGGMMMMTSTNTISEQRTEWISTLELTYDTILLAGLLPEDITAVAGVPRSGMIPASIIAAHLHLPLYQITEDGQLEQLGMGQRGTKFGFGDRPEKIAVIDDTLQNGVAMKKVKDVMDGRDAVFAAVYVNHKHKSMVDYYAREVGDAHITEWNCFNNGPKGGYAALGDYVHGGATDLDGIIIHDDKSGGVQGTAYMLPKSLPVRLIVTGRPERHREETEALLRRYGVRWGRLEMLPDDVPMTPENIAGHKAKWYTESPCRYFIESDPEQAKMIFEKSGKAVICPIESKVYE